MKTILLKTGSYPLSNTIFLPSLDVGINGENGTLILPNLGVTAFQGVGYDDLLCPKCDYALANKIALNQIRILEIKCPSCGTITKV